MSTWQMGHGLIIAHQLHNIILFCQCLWELEFSTQKWPIFTNNSKILLNTSIPPKKISIITCPQFPPSSQHFQHIYLHIQPLVTHSLYVTKPVQHILFRSLKHIFLITSLLLWHFFFGKPSSQLVLSQSIWFPSQYPYLTFVLQNPFYKASASLRKLYTAYSCFSHLNVVFSGTVELWFDWLTSTLCLSSAMHQNSKASYSQPCLTDFFLVFLIMWITICPGAACRQHTALSMPHQLTLFCSIHVFQPSECSDLDTSKPPVLSRFILISVHPVQLSQSVCSYSHFSILHFHFLHSESALHFVSLSGFLFIYHSFRWVILKFLWIYHFKLKFLLLERAAIY